MLCIAEMRIATACGLAMTVVVDGWSFWLAWAVYKAGRRGQCHPPYRYYFSITRTESISTWPVSFSR